MKNKNIPEEIINPSDFEYNEIKEKFSTWKNNNTQTAKFTLITNEKRPGKLTNYSKASKEEAARCSVTTLIKVEIPAGGTKQLPSEYDQAIRWVSPKTGEAVQGLCPWLTKIGEEDIVVHSSLDYKQAIQNQDALTMATFLKKEDELKQALILIEKMKSQIGNNIGDKK